MFACFVLCVSFFKCLCVSQGFLALCPGCKQEDEKLGPGKVLRQNKFRQSGKSSKFSCCSVFSSNLGKWTVKFVHKQHF